MAHFSFLLCFLIVLINDVLSTHGTLKNYSEKSSFLVEKATNILSHNLFS